MTSSLIVIIKPKLHKLYKAIREPATTAALKQLPLLGKSFLFMKGVLLPISKPSSVTLFVKVSGTVSRFLFRKLYVKPEINAPLPTEAYAVFLRLVFKLFKISPKKEC